MIKPYHPVPVKPATQAKNKQSSVKSVPEQNMKTMNFAKLSPEQPTPTTLFERMKTMLVSTIGNSSLARRFFGVYRQQTLPMLKFSIHEHKGDLFEQLGLQALQIAVQATKKKQIHNLPGYYAGTLRELIDKALFSEVFKEFDVPVEGFHWR